jgi:small subunit ribosomal protein S1
LADHKVENPQDEVQIGQELDVKILRVDTIERKIGLSKKRAEWATDPETEAAIALDKKSRSRRGGLEGGSLGDQLSNLITPATPATPPAEEEEQTPADSEA